jgi:6-oxo-cyclohex-1-ene-carbonyl-CoA hydrolase
MALEWLPRDNEIKDHTLWGDEYFGTMDKPPCVVYDKKPIVDPKGNPVEGLYAAWIWLNNPNQYNSYTTEMVKGVISGMTNASAKEYAEYYSGRPTEYALYMDLFNGMVDSILDCKKPVISRANGMRVAGGQEIGGACDLCISSDLAIYGQAGPRHGSAPVGGSSDFLPWYLGIEDAMWNCISCEMWSAYKMFRKGYLSKVVPVLKDEKGNWVRNPQVVTDAYVKDGAIVYGEFKTGDEAKAAREFVKNTPADFELLDKEVNSVLWTFTNLFPNCLQMSIDSIRAKKKFFWDQGKLYYRHWLATNMSSEAFLGFHAFNTKKITGKDTIDFIKYRQLIDKAAMVDEDFMAEVLAKPQKE